MSDSENGKGDNEKTPHDVKEDNEDEKETDDSKQEEKSNEEKPKKPSKKEEIKEEDDDDDGSEESEEEEVGLLDRPVEVSGSRERKKVERLELNFKTPSKDKPEIPEGRGEKLGECPRIEFKVQKTPVEELKALHKLLFNRPGTANEIKRNIRKFCGFSFSEGSAEFEKKKSALEKLKIGVLKHICEVLDIERSGLREEIALRILQFLLQPKSSGKAVPASKSKRRSPAAAAKGGKAKRTEKEKGSKKGSKKGKKASSDEEGSDESAEKDEEDEDEQEEVAVESDNSFEEPKKKKKSKPRKKKEIPVKDKKKEKNGDKSKKSEDKKAPAKSAKRKSDSSDDSDESSDGEPLAKKVKSPPSDDEIKQLVKKILDDADLEEITMKKVIKQVFDTYPEFDLSEKKDYIKATVKSVIS